HDGGKIELLLQLQRPLLAYRRRPYHEQPAPALRPVLAKHDASFDRLSKTDFVGQHYSLGQRRLQGKESGLDLVRVEIDRRIEKRHRESIQATRCAPRQVVGE